MTKDLETIHEEHERREPERFDKALSKLGHRSESVDWIMWKRKLDILTELLNLGDKKRDEVMIFIKKGNTLGETSKKFSLHLDIVCELLSLNIQDIKYLREDSI